MISVRAVARRIRQAVNLVADFESRHASTEFLDYSGQVPSENEREFMRPEVFHVAFTNFPIDRVHSRCVNADENFTRLWLRTRCIFVLEDLRSAVVVNLNCFHCSFLFCEQRSAARRALEKDYVSCLSITNRHAPHLAVEPRHFALPPARVSISRDRSRTRATRQILLDNSD